jgi:Domain of Unknown Function (DUF1080)
MFSRFTNVRMKTATALVVTAIFAIVPVYTFPAVHAAPQAPAPAAGQQAPVAAGAPAARGGRGGGGGFFTQPAPIDFDDHDGFVSLFDGTTLNNWTSDGTHWSVKDGSIYAQSTCEAPTGTIYIYSDIGQVDEFELKVRMKGTGAVNSGVQYRSWLTADMNSPKFPRPGRGPAGPGGPGAPGAPAARGAGAPGVAAGAGTPAVAAGRGPTGPCPSGAPRGTPPSRDLESKYDMGGPQYDFDNTDMYPGQFYEQSTGRGIIAFPGQVVEADPGKQKRLLATLADADTLKSWFHKDDWNEEVIIARGHTYTHILNGHVASVFIDNDPLYFQSTGHIGFEIESTGEIFIKDIWLKKY